MNEARCQYVFCVSIVDMWSSTWCMTGEWSLAWPRLAPESRASSCPSPSLPGKITVVWSSAGPAVSYDSNELCLCCSVTNSRFHPQVGVHARACQRYPGGRDAGGVTKPKGVGVTTACQHVQNIQVYLSMVYFIMSCLTRSAADKRLPKQYDNNMMLHCTCWRIF